MSAFNRYIEKVKLAGLLKEAMVGNSPLAQSMNLQSSQSMRAAGMPSGLPGYKNGGPVKKAGYLTDKRGKPYARVHKGEKVVPKDEKTKQAWAKFAQLTGYAGNIQQKQDAALGSSPLAKKLKPKTKKPEARLPRTDKELRLLANIPQRYRGKGWATIPAGDLKGSHRTSIHNARRLRRPDPNQNLFLLGERTPSGRVIGERRPTTIGNPLKQDTRRKVRVVPVPKKESKPSVMWLPEINITGTVPKPKRSKSTAKSLVGDDFRTRAKWLRSRGERWGSKAIRDKWKPETKRVMNQWWRTRKGARTAQQYASILTGQDVKPTLKAVAASSRKAPKKRGLVAKS